MRITSLLAVGCAMALAVAAPANADIVFQLQMPGVGTPAQTAGGTWIQEPTSGSNSLTNIAGTGISMTDSVYLTRTRGASVTTTPLNFSNLYQGCWILYNGTNVSFSGLNPATTYSFQFFCYDHDYVTSDTWAIQTGTAVGSSSLTTPPGGVATPEPDTYYSVTLTATPTAGGVVTFKVTDSRDYPRLNGLIVSTTPEPATMGLLAIGGLAAVIRRRRA